MYLYMHTNNTPFSNTDIISASEFILIAATIYSPIPDCLPPVESFLFTICLHNHQSVSGGRDLKVYSYHKD